MTWGLVVRPGDSQVGIWGSNACGGRIALQPNAFWAHDASKMALDTPLGFARTWCLKRSSSRGTAGRCTTKKVQNGEDLVYHLVTMALFRTGF